MKQTSIISLELPIVMETNKVKIDLIKILLMPIVFKKDKVIHYNKYGLDNAAVGLVKIVI